MSSKSEMLLYNLLNNEEIEKYKELEADNKCVAYSYNMQFFAAISRSLDYDNQGNSINYEKLEKELKLLNYYKNPVVNDKYLLLGIIPIMLSNENIEKIEKETIKYLLRFSEDGKESAKLLYAAYLIFYYLNNMEYIELSKEKLMDFSLVSSSESLLEKKTIIDFEKGRVKLIAELSLNGYSMENLVKYVTSVIQKTGSHRLSEHTALIIRFSNYFHSLKNGANKNKIVIEENTKFYHLKEGEIFSHRIFGKCSIVKSIEKEGKRIVIINTKYGTLRFQN